MNLAQKANKKSNFESLEDSLTDMAVYCAMFSAYLQNEHMKDSEKGI